MAHDYQYCELQYSLFNSCIFQQSLQSGFNAMTALQVLKRCGPTHSSLLLMLL